MQIQTTMKDQQSPTGKRTTTTTGINVQSNVEN